MKSNLRYSNNKVLTYNLYNDLQELVSTGKIIIDEKKEGKPAGLIEDIWTREDHRKQGLATQVMKQLLKIAKDYNCYKVVLMCADHNVTFYEKLGFRLHQNAMRIDL